MQFQTPNPKFFKIELLPSGIIYMARRGERTDEGIEVAAARGHEMMELLRKQGRPVLILNNASLSNAGPRVMELTIQLDFDRWAIYGAAARYESVIKLRVYANGLERKFAFFRTKDEAITWLQAFKSDRRP